MTTVVYVYRGSWNSLAAAKTNNEKMLLLIERELIIYHNHIYDKHIEEIYKQTMKSFSKKDMVTHKKHIGYISLSLFFVFTVCIMRYVGLCSVNHE